MSCTSWGRTIVSSQFFDFWILKIQNSKLHANNKIQIGSPMPANSWQSRCQRVKLLDSGAWRNCPLNHPKVTRNTLMCDLCDRRLTRRSFHRCQNWLKVCTDVPPGHSIRDNSLPQSAHSFARRLSHQGPLQAKICATRAVHLFSLPFPKNTSTP